MSKDPRASASLVVTAHDIAPLRVIAEKAGLDFSKILNGLNLSSDPNDGAGGECIHLEDYFRILGRLSNAAQDETCQLSLRPLIPGTTDFVFSALAKSPHLFDAMKRIAKSYNLVHGGVYNRVEKRRDGLVYIIDDDGFPYAFDGHGDFAHSLMEGVLIFLHTLLSQAADKDLFGSVKKIYTKRARKGSAQSFLAFWNAPVQCNANYYGLLYDLSESKTPIKLNIGEAVGNSCVYEVVAKMVAEKDADARSLSMTSRVINSLAAGIIDQNQVARWSGVSVATLRRRLVAEGSSFRELRHQVLNERAKSLLQLQRHISDVAQELGFADFRSFSRAFKQWNGVTPSAYAKSVAKPREDVQPAP